MQHLSEWVRKALAGLLVGIGCILPGVSGGVMAVSFGLYRPVLDAVLDFFHAPVKHARFLLPLGIGCGLGILVGAKGLSVVMTRYERLMLFLFIGFLLGGVPDLYREAMENGRFRPRRMLWTLLGGVAALPFLLLGTGDILPRMNAMQALITGLLEGVGTIVPGVSTSFLLIRLGWYQAYLDIMTRMALGQIVLIGVGFAISAFACMKGVQWLFDHHPGPVYAAVLGFLLLSIALVFPGFDTGNQFWADCALVVIGVISVRWLEGTKPLEEKTQKGGIPR